MVHHCTVATSLACIITTITCKTALTHLPVSWSKLEVSNWHGRALSENVLQETDEIITGIISSILLVLGICKVNLEMIKCEFSVTLESYVLVICLDFQNKMLMRVKCSQQTTDEVVFGMCILDLLNKLL